MITASAPPGKFKSDHPSEAGINYRPRSPGRLFL